VLIDQEHGMGGFDALLGQILAVQGGPAAPIVRVAWNEAWQAKRVLDLGAAGVMFPMVNDADQARTAVASMRYPPGGVRGMTSLSPPTGYGASAREYFERANRELVTVVQIETPKAVENAAEIAAVDGVDVLFVGPLDLSANMGIAGEFGSPLLRDAYLKVGAACRKSGKAAGTLLGKPEQIGAFIDDGFTFLGLGSDGGVLADGLRSLAAAFREHR
jgi:4-hydroxy-2-oxoheptanedioate aldolase